ncbi:MAG: hypothetical protein M3R64_04735 [Pseudomonadota bacterium]|nr:hypothetical protein [Pseudomonadota bacterium]
MATHHKFDDKSIQSALAAAQAHNKTMGLTGVTPDMNLMAGGDFAISGGCISVTVENGNVCLNLPLGIGNFCLPIPNIFPNGTAAQACISICTTWGFPTGVKVTVSIAGHVVVEKTFLKC